MKYLSVCSGIEAATVAWHPLGWTPLAFSEIEAFPRAVLQHHYPDVPLYGDFTKLRDEPIIEDADILVGGTPCQAFSVAGLRKSLEDDRGNLTLEFVRLADAIDNARLDRGKPASIIVWENVPGVLSVKDNAFGCFLSALAGDDTPYVPPRGKWTNAGVVAGPKRTVAWRVLDAQYFGLAQRRRRVFVVASAGDGFDPAEVLLECEGVRQDTPPRRETRETASGGATGRAGERSHWDGDGHPHPTLNQSAKASGGVGASNQELFSQRGAYLVEGKQWTAEGFNATTQFGNIAGSLTARHDSSPCADRGMNIVVQSASEDGTGRGTPLVPATVAHTLQTQCGFATEDGTGRGSPLVPIAFSYKDSGNDATEDLSPTLRSLGAYDANGGAQMGVAYPINTQIALRHNALGERTGMGIGDTEDPAFTLQAGHSHAVAYAFAQNTRDEVRLLGGDGQIAGALAAEPGMKQTTYVAIPQSGETVNTLTARGPYSLGIPEVDGGQILPVVANTITAAMGGSPTGHNREDNFIPTSMAVRRLTPIECERLQGFPDNYTLIPWKKKYADQCPDGPRYKALGNSMAVPCMRWIGERIARS